MSKPREELKRLTRLDNLIAGFFYLLTARTREELKEAEQLVSDRIDFASEFGRFYVIWLRKYLKHKGIKIQTHEKEGGKIMLETLVSSIKAEGKAEGKAEVKEEIARNMKKMGLKESTIAEATGLTVREIEKL
ncbi:MAG: hypothetical protein AB2L14_08990 [Candidatus Xenobiia bacterium LiM19]